MNKKQKAIIGAFVVMGGVAGCNITDNVIERLDTFDFDKTVSRNMENLSRRHPQRCCHQLYPQARRAAKRQTLQLIGKELVIIKIGTVVGALTLGKVGNVIISNLAPNERPNKPRTRFSFDTFENGRITPRKSALKDFNRRAKENAKQVYR